MELRIILGDRNPDLIDAWSKHFQGVENVECRGGNILFAKADALVSPANSFGFMDGGGVCVQMQRLCGQNPTDGWATSVQAIFDVG